MSTGLQAQIDELQIKIKALKDDRLRISDLLVDSTMERAVEQSILRGLVDATWPTPDGCRVCAGTVTDEGSGHKDDCAWFAAFRKVATMNGGA